MSLRPFCVLLTIVLWAAIFSVTAQAQVASVVFSASTNDVRVSFIDDIVAVDLSNTLVFYEDNTGKIVQVLCTTAMTSGSGTAVSLTNFRDITGAPANLMNGGGIVTGVIGTPRTYNIVLKGVQLSREPKARPISATVDVFPATNKAPVFTVAPISNLATIPYNRRILSLHPEGIAATVLHSQFQSHPEQVIISYKFSPDDLSPNVETTAANIELDPGSGDLNIEPKESLPLRAKKYTVKIAFPADQLRGQESASFQIPADAEFLVAAAVADLTPSGQTERAKTEFYIETTYTSTVNPKDRKRARVGIFGIHWRPVLPLLTRNVFGEEGSKPIWMAFRPLLEIDVDTQSPKISRSPNRIQFGMDYELGRDSGLQDQNRRSIIQQHVFINGVRYDSDRDFKLQTVYWHTEYVPRFLNFEQTTEARQFGFDNANKEPKRKGPIVSSYRIRPSIGYELGGIVKRDSRPSGVPTETISRFFSGLDFALEFKRVVKFGFVNTYYFLENANRRRNRDYFEGRIELNTGFLFNRNFNGLQSAIALKFQRGDQPPTFGSVNALSVGFKVFR